MAQFIPGKHKSDLNVLGFLAVRRVEIQGADGLKLVADEWGRPSGPPVPDVSRRRPKSIRLEIFSRSFGATRMVCNHP